MRADPLAVSSRKRRISITTFAVVWIYVTAPFVAGLLATYDPRGPKIYAREHHELLYKCGYYQAGHHYHDGKPRAPFMRERSWFYGIEGKLIPEDQLRVRPKARGQQ